ncbi:MAG: terminase small subunit [Sphingomonadales bacterium]|nr:terminase small subunit [Sphingomonadales bacterium]
MSQTSDSRHSDSEISAVELADWLGVSERAISDYARKGIIARSAPGKFRFRESVKAVTSHLRELSAQRGASSAGLTAQRERIARGQADKLEMQNAATRREMLPAKLVADEWASILRLVRSRMLAVPSRIQQQLGHLSAHDLDIIDREIRDALEEAANNGL